MENTINKKKTLSHYKFFKKEDFIFLESKNYILEFDFGLVDLDLVQISIKSTVEINVAWKRTAREINKNTFLKFYDVAKKVNEFTPVIIFN